MRYFDTATLDDAYFRRLSPHSRLLYFLLYFHPRGHFCGLFRLSLAHMAVDLKSTEEQTREAIGGLMFMTFMEWDSDEELIWLPRMTAAVGKFGVPQFTAARRHIESFPAVRVATNALAACTALLSSSPVGARALRIIARDGNRCRYCRSTEDLTLDHLIPPKKGGSQQDDNLVTACRSCNSRKGQRTPAAAGMVVLPIGVAP